MKIEFRETWKHRTALAALALVVLNGCKPAPSKKPGPTSPVVANPIYNPTPQFSSTPIGYQQPTTTGTTANWQQTSTFQPLAGCLKNQSLQQVEVVINGAIEAPVVIDGKAKNPRSNVGVPEQMTIEFNSGMASSATDALIQLRNNQGRLIIKDLASYTVDQIAYIKISLDGHRFQSMPFSESDFWQGSITRFQVTETNRFLINSLSVLINGQEFYRLGALSKTLHAGSPEWKEENILQNLVTKKIIQQDCTASTTPAGQSTPTPP